ncbi:hypothetical protein [Bosea sp. PAMC 26642]|uniref:hypothetical protein n=1 Tax=Bosea sp. (strain PAMC 26642) TaxID=1792307 RepID=UPI001439A88C|nr:hypothetical protein [Bosea sp. PAMC 26642]
MSPSKHQVDMLARVSPARPTVSPVAFDEQAAHRHIKRRREAIESIAGEAPEEA